MYDEFRVCALPPICPRKKNTLKLLRGKGELLAVISGRRRVQARYELDIARGTWKVQRYIGEGQAACGKDSQL